MEESCKAYSDGIPLGKNCCIGNCSSLTTVSVMIRINVKGLGVCYPYIPLCTEHFRALVNVDYAPQTVDIEPQEKASS